MLLMILITSLSFDCQGQKESLLNNWHFQMNLAFNAFALAYFLGILPSETSPKKKGQGERNTGDKKNQKSRIFAYMKTTFDFHA